jgi:hypothetical protein
MSCPYPLSYVRITGWYSTGRYADWDSTAHAAQPFEIRRDIQTHPIADAQAIQPFNLR